MKKSNVTVLGCGLVGSAIAKDLSEYTEVIAVDLNETALESLKSFNIKTLKGDVSNPELIKELALKTDIFIGAVPGFLGFNTVKSIIETGTDVVDISFFPEDAFLLDELAKKHNVTAIVDCGVAPGMGNVILGHYDQKMKIYDYYCEVGGLPKVREWPYEYKAVFSPRDVIEEYTRPARLKINNQMVVREALSDIVLDEYEGIGTLESWNSDGLRSLLKTMEHIPTLIEKTLRYPGTTQHLKVLRETGYFSEEPVKIGNNTIRPIDLTAALLFPKWTLKPGEKEFTVMKIQMKGIDGDKKKEVEYYLYDEFDEIKGISSMARTTGYTCTAAARLIMDKKYNQKGVIPPEYIGLTDDNFEFILKHLSDRNVIYKRSEKII
ncbi:MAG: saccharopine dehydrogenase NADP-binding domain-containing protein [Cyclobacteriaceae bacterium]|nr:saccharopine dehydrogenase NADP-binding domain-containing protein [Cyclobacteriaceae bacterium]